MKIAVWHIKFGQTYYLVIDRGQIMFKWDKINLLEDSLLDRGGYVNKF